MVIISDDHTRKEAYGHLEVGYHKKVTVMERTKQSGVFDDLSVYVVDDNIKCLQVMDAIVKSFGVKRVKTTDYVDWDYLRKPAFIPDVIFSDFRMPNYTGLDFLSDLRASKTGVLRHIPFAIVSSDNGPNLARKAQNLGSNFSISKPITPRQVYMILRFSLNKKDMLHTQSSKIGT